MLPSTELYFEHSVTFVLVLVRISALVIVAPIFGPFEVPFRVRALLALALTVLVVPLEVGRVTAQPDSLPAILITAGGEALVGLMLGLGVRILFSAMQIAGQLISQMSGFQLADVFNPGVHASVPVFSHLLSCVAAAVFFILGGHRRVIEALLDTFVWLPAGQGGFSRSTVDAVATLVAHSFVLGVRAAAPAVVALLLATVIIGLVSRTLPQLNVLSLGFGVNALVALAAFGVSLGGACWIFQDQIEPVLETALYALRPY
ncbi:MAG: flagellar biosynthetic protein FliR [Pirellulales bacterium]